MKNYHQLLIFVLILIISSNFIFNLKHLSTKSIKSKSNAFESSNQNHLINGFVDKNTSRTNLKDNGKGVFVKILTSNLYDYKFNLPIRRDVIKRNPNAFAANLINGGGCQYLENYTVKFSTDQIKRYISKLKITATFPGTVHARKASTEKHLIYFEMLFDDQRIGRFVRDIKWNDSEYQEVLNPKIFATVYNVTPDIHTLKFRACVSGDDWKSFTLNDVGFAYNSIKFNGDYLDAELFKGSQSAEDLLLPEVYQNVSRRKGHIVVSKDDYLNSIAINDILFRLGTYWPGSDNHYETHLYPFYGNDGDKISVVVTNSGGPGHLRSSIAYFNKEGFLEIQNSNKDWTIIGWETRLAIVNDQRENEFGRQLPPLDGYSDYIWTTDYSQYSSRTLFTILQKRVTHSALYLQNIDLTSKIDIKDKFGKDVLKSAFTPVSLKRNWYTYDSFLVKLIDKDFSQPLKPDDKISITSDNANPRGLLFAYYYKDSKGRVHEVISSRPNIEKRNSNKVRVLCATSITDRWVKIAKAYRNRTLLDLALQGANYLKDYDSSVNNGTANKKTMTCTVKEH